MSWTKVSAVLPAVLAACARVTAVDEAGDAGSSQPAVAAVDPQPGPVPAGAQFTVQFTAPMDEGPLIAKTGRSESVVLAAEANVELAAAAIEHGALSAYERTLLIDAEPAIAADRKSITLAPDQPLAPGNVYLLVSSRLKDSDGRKLAGPGLRYAFQVAAPATRPRLISPSAGGDAPANLAVVRAFASAGRLALHGADGGEVAAADAHGDVLLPLAAPLEPGARYLLALDGAEDDSQSFAASPCTRDAAPAIEGGQAELSATDTAVVAALALDWPSTIEMQVAATDGGAPCDAGCSSTTAFASCAAKACGPQSFDCKLSLRIDGLAAAQDYALQIIARDDLGHESRGPVQTFSTVAPLPRVMISELMAVPVKPQETGEYVELLNFGPGVAVLDSLALIGADGTVRPLLAVPPPVPVHLEPGARALAVGASFDPSRYPSLPPGTPILRASTHRLLGRGLPDDGSEPLRLVMRGTVPIELSQFPGKGPACPPGTSIQRDETIPPQSDAAWSCGTAGGTPGAPP